MTTQTQQISEYRKKLASAYRAVYAVGVLSIFMGILAFIAANRVPESMILRITFLAFGLLYLVLGFFVQRRSHTTCIGYCSRIYVAKFCHWYSQYDSN